MGKFRHITIIGVGLLGGSVGLAVKKRWPGAHVAGVGRRRTSLRQALRAGAIDSAHLDAADAAGRSDLVILATPVGAFEKYLRAVKPLLKRGAIVTDVGSTKADVVTAAARILGRGGPFVGSHPMAGSERKGPAFARADLLGGAKCIITPTAATPAAACASVERFWRELGMKTVRMAPAAHDRAVAAVSHLPHALSCLLMLLPGDDALKLAAGGFRDTTRLAGGDPEVWRDIFLANRRELLAALSTFDKSAARLRKLLSSADASDIEKFLAVAKARRETFAGF